MADGTRAGYDAVAAAYAGRFSDELDHKPFDRELLDGFARRLAGAGPVVDLGCGPGQITAYLAGRGVEMSGIDLSQGMVDQARAQHPDIPFRTGDMRALPFEDESLAALVAFYSIIHIPRPQISDVLTEARRVLKPDGLLLMSFHLGSRTEHLEEFFETKVSIDFVFFERDEMERNLEAADFALESSRERDPYPDVEAQTRRAYLLARREGQKQPR